MFTGRISGTCAHAAELVFTIQHYRHLGLNEVLAELSCTSLPQQWHRPRGSKIEPEPVSSMVFLKPKPTSRKKKPTKSNVNTRVGHINTIVATLKQTSVVTNAPFNLCRIPDVYPEEIKKLKVDPLLPLSYLLQEDVGLHQSNCGNMHEGSMLIYHLNNNILFQILLSLTLTAVLAKI